MTLRRRVKRLVALLRNERLDRELDEEIQAHLEMAELDAIARPLAEKARPHIDVLLRTPEDQIRIYNDQLGKVRDWDKAVKKLASKAAE